MNREELIKEKRKQLEILKAELAELTDSSIGSMIKHDTLAPFGPYSYTFNTRCLYPCRNQEAWKKIVGMSMEIFRGRVAPNSKDRLVQSSLSYEQKKKCAQFCNEVIEIYNRYIKEEYTELPLYEDLKKEKDGDTDDE